MGRGWRCGAVVVVIGLLVQLAIGDAAGAGVGTAASGGGHRIDSPAAWAPLDGFEDPHWPDPGLWRFPEEPGATWGPSTCQAKSGRHALRAFSRARGPVEEPCEAEVPAGAVSTITMVLDLRETTLATRIDLFFEAWLRLAEGEDGGLFVHVRVPQADGSVQRVPIFGATATSGLWAYPPRKLDLLNVTDIEDPGPPIDLRGGIWELEWTAYAPDGAPAGGGVYLDDVTLVWEPDPAVPTPTRRPRPTDTPRPTLTPEPTPTRQPSATATTPPTPTANRAGVAYLPLLGYDAPATPTPAITATSTVTATVTVGPGTAVPSETVPVEPTPTDSAPGTATIAPTGTETPSVTATPAATATARPAITPGPMDWWAYLPRLYRGLHVVIPTLEPAEGAR